MKIFYSQNIFDVMIQETGGLNNTAHVLKDNGLNFNDSLTAGDTITIDSDLIEVQDTVDNYSLNSFRPANEELTETTETSWILADGTWVDDGIWEDTATWIDN